MIKKVKLYDQSGYRTTYYFFGIPIYIKIKAEY